MQLRRIVVNPAYDYLEDWVVLLPNNFAKGRLIHDGRNCIRAFSVDSISVMVKRYRKPNFFQRLVYSTIRTTKAHRAYDHALQLLQIGLDTPGPVAYLEMNNCLLFSFGYFVYLEDSRRSCLYLDKQPVKENQNLIDSIAAFIAHMHDKGFVHKDLNLGNILHGKNMIGEDSFALIDINRSKFLSHVNDKTRLRDLYRLSARPEVLRALITKYAQIRGWNPEEAYAVVSRLVDYRKKKKKLLHTLFSRNKR